MCKDALSIYFTPCQPESSFLGSQIAVSVPRPEEACQIEWEVLVAGYATGVSAADLQYDWAAYRDVLRRIMMVKMELFKNLRRLKFGMVMYAQSCRLKISCKKIVQANISDNFSQQTQCCASTSSSARGSSS